MKKTRAIKIKIQEKHMTSTSLLMFSPEFRKIKGMDICYIKDTPYDKNRAEAYYLRVFTSKYSYYRYLLSSYLHNYANRVQYTVVKAIISF